MHFLARALYKDLEKLKPYLEEYEDKECGKYPYPKYYRASQALMTIVAQVKRIDSAWKRIEERFLKTKDLAFALEEINAIDNLSMIYALLNFKDAKPPPEIIEDLLYIFNWRGHQTLTKKLALTCLKDIDNIDFEKTLESLIFTKEGKEIMKRRRKSKDEDTT